VHIGDASLTFWFNPALTLDAPSGTHLVWAPSMACASGAASCSAALPESARTRLSTAFEIRVADPTAGEQILVPVNISTGSIAYDISLVAPSQQFVLDASPTDLT